MAIITRSLCTNSMLRPLMCFQPSHITCLSRFFLSPTELYWGGRPHFEYMRLNTAGRSSCMSWGSGAGWSKPCLVITIHVRDMTSTPTYSVNAGFSLRNVISTAWGQEKKGKLAASTHSQDPQEVVHLWRSLSAELCLPSRIFHDDGLWMQGG